MITVFRATADLLQSVRADLERPHAFAAERVGFLICRAARLPLNGLLVLAASYDPVADADYLDDRRVGAMMGPHAIRKALQRAYAGGAGNLSLFHVHMHDHAGIPGFSRVDLTESAKFVPDFFNVAPTMPHGIIVLSHDRAAGLCWRKRGEDPRPINRCSSVGAPLISWVLP